MRLEENYSLEKNGKYINSSRTISLDATDLLKVSEREGFVAVSEEI